MESSVATKPRITILKGSLDKTGEIKDGFNTLRGVTLANRLGLQITHIWDFFSLKHEAYYTKHKRDNLCAELSEKCETEDILVGPLVIFPPKGQSFKKQLYCPSFYNDMCQIEVDTKDYKGEKGTLIIPHAIVNKEPTFSFKEKRNGNYELVVPDKKLIRFVPAFPDDGMGFLTRPPENPVWSAIFIDALKICDAGQHAFPGPTLILTTSQDRFDHTESNSSNCMSVYPYLGLVSIRYAFNALPSIEFKFPKNFENEALRDDVKYFQGPLRSFLHVSLGPQRFARYLVAVDAAKEPR